MTAHRDYLADHVYDIYFVDLGGYGAASRPAEMIIKKRMQLFWEVQMFLDEEVQ